jgi:hypothetical protein
MFEKCQKREKKKHRRKRKKQNVMFPIGIGGVEDSWRRIVEEPTGCGLLNAGEFSCADG